MNNSKIWVIMWSLFISIAIIFCNVITDGRVGKYNLELYMTEERHSNHPFISCSECLV